MDGVWEDGRANEKRRENKKRIGINAASLIHCHAVH
jgi:hypothetical protein